MDQLIESLRAEREQNRMSAGSHYILIDADTLSFEHQDASDQLLELQPAILVIGEVLFLSTGAFIEAEVLELTDTLRQQILAGEVDPRCEAIIAHPDEYSLSRARLAAWRSLSSIGCTWRQKAQRSLHRPPHSTSGTKNATTCLKDLTRSHLGARLSPCREL